MATTTTTHVKRGRLKYISLAASFLAATASLAAVYFGSFWAGIVSALLWMLSAAVEYYSTLVHGLPETRLERVYDDKSK